MTPLLSIIVPVYNTEKYLENCIQSILHQTFQDWELILIDDGSTDRSGVICDQYAANDCRIHITHKKNQGLSSARNKGIELSQGQYITFIDSDDDITPETYYDNILLFQEYEGLEVVQYPTFEGYGNGQGILCKYPKQYLKTNKEIQIAFLNHLPIVSASVCNKIFSRDVIDKLRFREGILHEDYIFTDQLVQKIGKLFISESGCYHYYHRESSITQSNNYKRHLNLLSCDILRLERRYAFPELKNLLLEQYIFVIRESQNIRYEFPKIDMTEYDEWIIRLKPPFSSIFQKALFKEKIWFLIISIIGLCNFTKLYQKILTKNRQ